MRRSPSETGTEIRRSQDPRAADIQWLQAHPSNRDGADKTWVLALMRRLDDFFESARPLPGIGPDGDGPLR
jgi:hypothetical protein